MPKEVTVAGGLAPAKQAAVKPEAAAKAEAGKTEAAAAEMEVVRRIPRLTPAQGRRSALPRDLVLLRVFYQTTLGVCLLPESC